MEKTYACCGVKCNQCQYYPEECAGCNEVKGKPFYLEYTGEPICKIYNCCINQKKQANCGNCKDLPCTYFDGSDPTKSEQENIEDFKNQLMNLKKLKNANQFSWPIAIESQLEVKQKERLYQSICKFADKKLAREIIESVDLPLDATDKQRAIWVKETMSQLECQFDLPTINMIRQACHCDEAGQLQTSKKRLREMYLAVNQDLAAFVAKMNEYNAGWYIDDNILYTKMFNCECPMLEAIDLLDHKSWCYCTAGYNKSLFDYVFDHPVNVELLKSIKRGDEYCLLKINKT